MANINGFGLGILSFLVIFLCLSEVLVDAVTSSSYEFGEDCFSSNGGLKEDAKITVRYEGKKFFVCDYFSFEPGKSSETGISYKLCVRPFNFTDPDCSVQLELKSSYFGSILHTITCSTGTTANFCGDEDDELYIFFKKRGFTTTNNARFMLQVYAQRVDNSNIVWGVIGGVLGAIVLFSACAGLVFWFICKRKPAQGRVLNPGQANAGTAFNQPAYPYASYSTQAGNPATNLYPVGNYPTQYSSGTIPQPQYQYQFQPSPQPAPYQEPEKVPSAPPPSYDEAHK